MGTKDKRQSPTYTDKEIDVSVIYVNYKTAPLILNSIQSVKEKTENISYEIIVVDNASNDGSLSLIRQTFPDVVCVQSDKNLGFGKANNLGLEQVSGKCVFFLNPDTLLINNAIKELYAFLMSSSQIGACGGNLYDENGNPTNSFGRRYPSFFWEFLSIFYISPINLPHWKSSYFNFTDKPLPVASIMGADLMVKRDLISRDGAFDHQFFMNFEETDLCYRLHKRGLGIYCLPNAKIIHLEGRSSYIKESRLYYLYEGQYIYFKKHYGRWGVKLIYLLTQGKNYIRLFQFTLLMNKSKLAYWNMKRKTNLRAYNNFKAKDK